MFDALKKTIAEENGQKSKKYEFTGNVKVLYGRTLHQIRATAAFGLIKAGEIGGWIEKEENLSHEGNAWVWGNAEVCGDAEVWGQSHYMTLGPIGSRCGFTTFFRSKNLEIGVSCGCFRGNIEAFAEKVKETHGENEYAKRYMAAIELAKACIDLMPAEERTEDSDE